MSGKHLPVAMLMVAIVIQPGGASAEPLPPPTAAVDVSMERMLFPDGLYLAAFEVEGACPKATDDVQVLEAECDEDPGVPDRVAGTLRFARLGFDALRRVEAGDSDRPMMETAQAAAPEQLAGVHVDLREPGDLVVEIAGIQTLEVDPRPIDGSASLGGQISDRSVTWSVPSASAGVHDFAVRFAPTATAGFTGTFVPQVTVRLSSTSATLLEGGYAAVPSPVPAQRTSTLVMRQRVAPAYGPPITRASPYVSVASPLPSAWATQLSIDAAGAYSPLASGEASVTSPGRLDDLAPGLRDVFNSMSITTLRPLIPGGDKVGHQVGPLVEDGAFTGFSSTLRTAAPSPPVLSADPPQGPHAGMLWDGDAAELGVTGTAGVVKAVREGEPTDPGGVVATDWDGSMALAWSGLWANAVPGGEPNALNYGKHYWDTYYEANGFDVGPYAAVAIGSTTIPVVARGGDIDNRGGGTLVGETLSIPAPDGHTIGGVAMTTVFRASTRYQHDFAFGPGKRSVRITPKVGPDGVWLESTQDGYDRDWSNLHLLSLTSIERGRDYDGTGFVTETVLRVPPGAKGVVDFLDAQGRAHRTTVTPGVWQVLVTDGRVLVQPEEVGSGDPHVEPATAPRHERPLGALR
jgi:hypothetical protein